MEFYRTRNVIINSKDKQYSYFDNVTHLANNLSNAVRFRQRQIYTAVRKDPEKLSDHEHGVLKEFSDNGYAFDREQYIPTTKVMEDVMEKTHNPDYFAKGLSAQARHHVIDNTCQDMWNYVKEKKDYYLHPEKYNGEPKYPGYKRKGGQCTLEFTNQDCAVHIKKDGKAYVGFPYNQKDKICLSFIAKGDELAHVTVTPMNGVFQVSFVFKVTMPDAEYPLTSGRIVGIDFGVDNFMAVTNNCGLPLLLYKGGVVKSVNQLYNKKLASIMEVEMEKPDCPKNKDGNPGFVPTPESKRITQHRNNSVHDFMLKTACHFIRWCVDNRIDTVVVGVNKEWKQESPMDHVRNQNFVQIPYADMRWILSYKCAEHRILYVEQEESYTSKASFLDGDYIPTYGVDDDQAKFSGRRKPTRYKGMYRKKGFRGLYKAKDGTIINSDLNGSANIIRKAFPDAFTCGTMPDFTDVVIINYVGEEADKRNHTKQMAEPATVSKSKTRRMKHKQHLVVNY